MDTPSTASEQTPTADHARWFVSEVHPHGPQLKAYLRGVYPDVRDVDDVVQESFVRIWLSHLGRPITSAKACLFRIARNVAIDDIRAQLRIPISKVGDLSSLPVLAEDTGAAAAALREKKLRIVADAMAILPPRGREVFLLRKIEGCSQKETAAKLGIAEKTVDEHLSRALKKLGAHVKRLGIDQAFNP